MRGYAITPRKSESNAPGPDYKLISVPEDGSRPRRPKRSSTRSWQISSAPGASVTITNHGRPVAVLMPAHQDRRRFVQLPALAAADTWGPMPALTR